jgi:hypothetical protein
MSDYRTDPPTYSTNAPPHVTQTTVTPSRSGGGLVAFALVVLVAVVVAIWMSLGPAERAADGTVAPVSDDVNVSVETGTDVDAEPGAATPDEPAPEADLPVADDAQEPPVAGE